MVTANRRSNSFYKSNAQLVVYRLVGDFDPNEAITHGYIDSQQQPAWRTTNASLADFNGSPSSIIEGTYRQDQMTVNTSRRHVIVTSGPDKYLVSLAVTTDAAQAVAEAPSTDGIVNGFRAGPPGSTQPAAPAAAPAPPAPAAPPAVVVRRRHWRTNDSGPLRSQTNRYAPGAQRGRTQPRMVSPCSSRECCASAWPC